MDRTREPDRGATLLMVPQVPSEAVRVVNLGGVRARGWRWATVGLAATVVVFGVALALTLPRASAYTTMMEENFALKASLESVEREMAEIDRILLRLRLYDAQLESLGAGGPVDAVAPERAPAPPAGSRDRESMGIVGPVADRAATAWAQDIEARSRTFIDLFEDVEPDLTVLVQELESLEALDRALPSFWPAAGFLTSEWGWRRDPLGVHWQHHAGIDVSGQVADPIWAAAAGTVRRAGWSGTFGKVVEIDHGFGVTTTYAHCSRVFVRTGQHVRRGQQIAQIGNTGRSTGPHLHFEVRLEGSAVNPLDYLPERRAWVPPWRTADGD